MKKFIVICLSAVMLFSMSVVAFAAPGSFVESPSVNPAPQIISFEPNDEGCTAQLIVTPYAEKSELNDTFLKWIEGAYKDISNSEDLTQLNAELATVAKQKGIAGENLAVSDLFDIHATGCAIHDGHYHFKVKLGADTLYRFVGLLHKVNGEKWELVGSAKVVDNGEAIEFTVKSFSPFAIVVDTTGAETSPQTGYNSMMNISIMMIAVSGVLLAFVAIKKDKKA